MMGGSGLIPGRPHGVMAVLAVLLAGTVSAQTFLDTALAGEAYRVQGEYTGTVGSKVFGAQVIAWGAGKYEAVLLPGGLPGQGWGSNPADFKGVKGTTTGTNTIFAGSGWNLIIKAGGALVEGSGPDGAVKLNKVYRESATLNAPPPTGAVKMFDGTQASLTANWSSGRLIEGKYLSEGSDSKVGYPDQTLHVEFRPPFEPLQDEQGRGNSGVYVQGHYEVQVLDSFGWMKGTDHGGAEGWAGGIYDTRPADFNMAFPPLRWETYDIHLTQPKFSGNTKTANARITVWFNGVKIQNNIDLPRTTPGSDGDESPTPGKLYLQNHGGPMWYRNIWIVPNQFVSPPTVGIRVHHLGGPAIRPKGAEGRYHLVLSDAVGAGRSRFYSLLGNRVAGEGRDAGARDQDDRNGKFRGLAWMVEAK